MFGFLPFLHSEPGRNTVRTPIITLSFSIPWPRLLPLRLVVRILSFVLTTVGPGSPTVSPWSNLFGPPLIGDRLATIYEGLRHWQSAKRATEWERIPRLKSEINRLSSRRLSPQGLEGELCHLLKVQEAYWAQRSRVLWLSAGDQNTSFFHAKASARKKKNAILGLYDSNGSWQTSTTEVLRVGSDYFVSLFSANPPVDAPLSLNISPPLLPQT
ncbi:hypothetical protein GQ457_16G017860 [Hibiscus cannabinus]